MIMLLGGTTEGREIASLLRERGYPFFTCITTRQGEEMAIVHGEVLREKLGSGEMEGLIEERGVSVVVDATHPFAYEASRNAIKACENTGARYVRYERQRLELSHAEYASSLSQAGTIASRYSTVFYTAGSNGLEEFLSSFGGGRVVVRVLPDPESIARVIDMGISGRDILAIMGPFSKEFNEAAFREYGAEVVVTKDSGEEGGLGEKEEACRALGIPMLVVERPELHYPLAVSSYSGLLQILEDLF